SVSVVATSTSTQLVVRYDGSRPPTALFGAWNDLGWRAPVPASPPRDAIDWSTPDPVRGTNHTIRPFTVVDTASLDDDRRRDADDLVRVARALAEQLGCRGDRPVTAEIDLRDGPDQPVTRGSDEPPAASLPAAPRPGVRAPRLRRSRGAQAR